MHNVDLVQPTFNFHVAVIFSGGPVLAVCTQSTHCTESFARLPHGTQGPWSPSVSSSHPASSVFLPQLQGVTNYITTTVLCTEPLGPKIPSSWDTAIFHHHLMIGILLLLFLVISFYLFLSNHCHFIAYHYLLFISLLPHNLVPHSSFTPLLLMRNPCHIWHYLGAC